MQNVALIIFTDSKNLVLLQQKTYDAPNFPGIWSLFGGSVETGESALEAIVREVHEELDLSLSKDDVIHWKDFVSSEKTRHIFLGTIADTTQLTLREGRGLGYFTMSETTTLTMPDHIRKILTEYWNEHPPTGVA